MRRSRTPGRYVVGLLRGRLGVLRPSVAVVSCLLSSACGLFGSGSPSPLRGYRVLIEARDSLSDYLADALSNRGFTVRRRIKGGSPPTAAVITFTYRELGPAPVTWVNVVLADTRSGAVVAAVSAPIQSLGATHQTRAHSLADSLAAQLASRSPPPPP